MSKKLQVSLTQGPSSNSITVVYNGKTYGPATEDHPAYGQIVSLALADDPKAVDLFDVVLALGKRENLSERIAYANGHLFFDGDEVKDSLAQHIIRMVSKGDNFKPLAAFMETLAQNPSKHSREQLWSWLANRFTLTEDGHLIMYKAVEDHKEQGYFSRHAGQHALVNGVPQPAGKVPNPVGAVIEMPRHEVTDNPHDACSVGLHTATYDFAKGFISTGTVLEVLIHPRDVVSVPGHDSTKVRVCKYKILGVSPIGGRKEPVKHTNPKHYDVADKHPSKAVWKDLTARARAQKKGIEAFLLKRGYKRVSNGACAPDQHGERKRECWLVPEGK